MAWNPPSDTEIEVDKPLKAVDIRRIRDLSESMALGESGSPVVGLTRISSAAVSGVATVDFTGFDNTRYESYVFDWRNVAGTLPRMRTSTDGGTTFDSGASDYKWGMMIDSTKSSSTAQDYIRLGPTDGNGMSGVITIIDPDASAQTIVFSSFSDDEDVINSGGRRVATTAVDAVQFSVSTSTFTAGTITMYGRGL